MSIHENERAYRILPARLNITMQAERKKSMTVDSVYQKDASIYESLLSLFVDDRTREQRQDVYMLLMTCLKHR